MCRQFNFLELGDGGGGGGEGGGHSLQQECLHVT